jgi:uncharacterized damage-inducible protein DinB
MDSIGALLAEYKQECANTRKLLERVPFDNPAWKPHEKSMALIDLAKHIAEIPTWMKATIEHDELDFSKTPYQPKTAANTEELLQIHDESTAAAFKSLSAATEEALLANWTLRNGEQVYFTMPKSVCLRSFVYNHLYHHRGQLTVYLRLLNVPLPGMYGPTADDQNM